MKTLDEVIEALEDARVQVETGTGYWVDYRDNDKLKTDALHYLKEYRSDKAMWEADRKGHLDWIEQYKEAREKHQQAVIELKKNPPLTWDELRTMEGKPVWIENMFYKKWLIAYQINESDIIFDGNGFYTQAFVIDYGKSWQAYRKERSWSNC